MEFVKDLTLLEGGDDEDFILPLPAPDDEDDEGTMLVFTIVPPEEGLALLDANHGEEEGVTNV